jgi:hypothetical protein
MKPRFTWVYGARPPDKGVIVLVRGAHLCGWSHLPEGVAETEIEKGFAEAYDFSEWSEPIVCQANVVKDGEMVDQWQFTIHPPYAFSETEPVS